MTENPMLWQESGKSEYEEKLEESAEEEKLDELLETPPLAVGLFDRYQSAHVALTRLLAEGFKKEQLSLVTQEETIKAYLADETLPEAGESAERLAVTGTVAGGLTGLLAGLTTMLIPGIGPVLAAGHLATVLSSALAGAGVGAIGGGLGGLLINLGLVHADAELYSQTVARGGVLITVHGRADERAQARDIMREAGAIKTDHWPH